MVKDFEFRAPKMNETSDPYAKADTREQKEFRSLEYILAGKLSSNYSRIFMAWILRA